jgi:plastocyanin
MLRRASRLSAIVSVGLLLAACGSNGGGAASGGGATSTTGGGGETEQTITIKDFAFHPDALTLPSGQDVTIEITNEDSGVEHSFTLNDDSVSQDVEGGEDAKVTLNLSEGIGWHCEYHPDTMKGTITVS